MLDLEAEIVPGVGAAGITIGQSIEALLALGMEADVEPRVARRLLTFGPVSAIDDDTGVIGGIWVKGGYIGMGEYQIAKGTPWLDNDWTFIVERGNPVMGEPDWEEACIECINVGA